VDTRIRDLRYEIGEVPLADYILPEIVGEAVLNPLAG
jgi:hypothetical protein